MYINIDKRDEKGQRISVGLQLVPSFVLVLHQQLSGVVGELFGLGHHPGGPVLQVAEFFASFYGQLVGPRYLAGRRAGPIAQRVQLRRRARNVTGHELGRFAAGRLADCREGNIKNRNNNTQTKYNIPLLG